MKVWLRWSADRASPASDHRTDSWTRAQTLAPPHPAPSSGLTGHSKVKHQSLALKETCWFSSGFRTIRCFGPRCPLINHIKLSSRHICAPSYQMNLWCSALFLLFEAFWTGLGITQKHWYGTDTGFDTRSITDRSINQHQQDILQTGVNRRLIFKSSSRIYYVTFASIYRYPGECPRKYQQN